MDADLAQLIRSNAILQQLPPDDQKRVKAMTEALHLTLATEESLPVRCLALEIMRRQTVIQSKQQLDREAKGKTP